MVSPAHYANIQGPDKPWCQPGFVELHRVGVERLRIFSVYGFPQRGTVALVQKEVDWWLTNRSAQTFLILLTEGEIVWDEAKGEFDWTVTTALPTQLSKVFTEEPLYTDLRWARTVDQLSVRHSQFRGAILEVASTVLKRPKDGLDGDDVQQYRKTRRLAWSGVAALAGLLWPP